MTNINDIFEINRGFELDKQIAELTSRAVNDNILPKTRRCPVCGLRAFEYIDNDEMINRHECSGCGHSAALMITVALALDVPRRSDSVNDWKARTVDALRDILDPDCPTCGANDWHPCDDGAMRCRACGDELSAGEWQHFIELEYVEYPSPGAPEGAQDRDNVPAAGESPQDREKARRERDTALPNWTGKFRMRDFWNEERPSTRRRAERRAKRGSLPTVPESEKVRVSPPADAPQTFAEAKVAEAAATDAYDAAIKKLLQMRRDGADASDIKQQQLLASELRAAKTAAMHRRIALDMNN
jgi:transcription elongation factor Elf1